MISYTFWLINVEREKKAKRLLGEHLFIAALMKVITGTKLHHGCKRNWIKKESKMQLLATWCGMKGIKHYRLHSGHHFC